MFRFPSKDFSGVLLRWLAVRLSPILVRRAVKTPYTHIGDYMQRYWLVPFAVSGTASDHGCGPVSFWRRPIARVLQLLGVAVRIHVILRSDDDDAYHDHPWDFMTFILDGGYYEYRPLFSEGLKVGNSCQRYDAGSLNFRRAEDMHRLELRRGEPAITLFVTTKWRQIWGFFPDSAFKVEWKEYLARNNRRARTQEEAVIATNVAEDQTTWVACTCKDCNGLTYLARYDLPKMADLMAADMKSLEEDNRYPQAADSATIERDWCTCGDDSDERIIAHVAKEGA